MSGLTPPGTRVGVHKDKFGKHIYEGDYFLYGSRVGNGGELAVGKVVRTTHGTTTRRRYESMTRTSYNEYPARLAVLWGLALDPDKPCTLTFRKSARLSSIETLENVVRVPPEFFESVGVAIEEAP